jgi:hypothetical protein
MESIIKFKSYGKTVVQDISTWREDAMDESLCININERNWKFLKESSSEKKLFKIVENDPRWLEFI